MFTHNARTSGVCAALTLAALCLPSLNVQAASAQFQRTYTGTLGRYPIRMTLNRQGRTLRGSYVYLNNGTRISVRGTFTPTSVGGRSFSNIGEFKIQEYDGKGRRSGHFEGSFTTSSILRGSWWKTERPQNRLSFTLEESGRSARQFTGSWSHENGGYTFSLDLTQRGNQLEGSYCAVTENARRVDCLSPVTGTVSGSTAQVRWTSSYGEGSGSATLTRTRNGIRWVVGSRPDSEAFAPPEANLRRTRR